MKIKIAVVGLNFGWHMIEEIQESEDFELAAVCVRTKARADEVAAQFGVKAYYDLDTLLEDNEIGAVGLFTGPVGRAEQIRKIIRSGKHVMTTKPFELDSAAAKAVLEEAKQLKKVVHINSPNPVPAADMRQILEWRDKYDLGRPIGCYCGLWANYFDKADGGWYDDPQLCPVPPIYRLGIYLINDLVQLLGEPEKLTVMQSRIRTGRPTSDNASLAIMFKNKAIANVFATFCVGDGRNYRNSLILNYEKGTIYRNIGTDTEEGMAHLSIVAHEGTVVESNKVSERSGHYQWKNFYKAINGEALDREITIEMITAGIKIIEAMREVQDGGIACLA